MSTGRNSYPPEWAQQLTELSGALGASCVTLQPVPFCDTAGVTQGYVALLYHCGVGTVTRLQFDTALQLTARAVTGSPCATEQGGGYPLGANLFYDVSDVCLEVAGVVIEARQVIVRDVTGTPVVHRFENIQTGAVVAGTIVECVC